MHYLILAFIVAFFAFDAEAYTCLDDKRTAAYGDSYAYRDNPDWWGEPCSQHGCSSGDVYGPGERVNAMTQDCFPHVAQEGIGGQTTSQILARIDDVLGNSQVQHIRLESPIHNDLIQYVDAATTKANVKAIRDAVIAHNQNNPTIRLTIHTTPEPANCWGYSGAHCQNRISRKDDVNAYIKTLDYGWWVCITDVEAGSWAIDNSSGNYTDGLHYNATGAYKAAKSEIKQCHIPVYGLVQ